MSQLILEGIAVGSVGAGFVVAAIIDFVNKKKIHTNTDNSVADGIGGSIKTSQDFKFGPYRKADPDVVYVPRPIFEPKKKTEVIKWNWSDKNECYTCPKCGWGQSSDARKHPQICYCNEYEKTHFHFYCTVCKFSPIMKTKDDKE